MATFNEHSQMSTHCAVVPHERIPILGGKNNNGSRCALLLRWTRKRRVIQTTLKKREGGGQVSSMVGAEETKSEKRIERFMRVCLVLVETQISPGKRRERGRGNINASTPNGEVMVRLDRAVGSRPVPMGRRQEGGKRGPTTLGLKEGVILLESANRSSICK